MRPRAPTIWLSLFVGLLSVACRQTSADLALPDTEPTPSEPSGRGGPSIIVETPGSSASGPILDWTAVDNQLDNLILATATQRMRVTYDEQHPWVGATVPLVTIVVFSDYQCPYCDRLDQTLDQLLGRYPDVVRVVYRQFPLPSHREAEFAASVALAAHAQGKFTAMHRWLYENMHALNPMSVAERAASYGLDTQRLIDEVDGDHHAARIDADLELGKRFDVAATPSWFINGRPGNGAQPIEEFDKLVREELQLGERLLAAGSRPEQVWARILAASTDTAASVSVAAITRFETQLANLPRRGPSKAKVEILMCGDFDCPYCQKSIATLAQLQQSHPSDVAVYFRNHPLPMHANARAAHRAAVAADNQGQFWAMFELLYADTSKRSTAELEDMAKQLKLDIKRFRKDVTASKTEERIDAELAFCEQALGASGTPTFFINGRELIGAQPISEFEQIIQAELAITP